MLGFGVSGLGSGCGFVLDWVNVLDNHTVFLFCVHLFKHDFWLVFGVETGVSALGFGVMICSLRF